MTSFVTFHFFFSFFFSFFDDSFSAFSGSFFSLVSSFFSLEPSSLSCCFLFSSPLFPSFSFSSINFSIVSIRARRLRIITSISSFSFLASSNCSNADFNLFDKSLFFSSRLTSSDLSTSPSFSFSLSLSSVISELGRGVREGEFVEA